MLAVVGYLVTAAGIRFPGAEGIPDGLAAFPALHTTDDGKVVLMQMLAFFAVAEMVNRDAFGKAEFIGDFRNGALDFGWDSFSEETKLRKRKIELNQGKIISVMRKREKKVISVDRQYLTCVLLWIIGRAAMMGITGLITHEVLGVSILPGGYLPGN